MCEAFGPLFNSSMDVVVRTAASPHALIPAVRSVVHELDPAAPVYGVTTLDSRLDEYAADRRLQAWLLSGLSLLTLFLGAVGICGVTQYVVSQRRREMAIRLVLGANARNIKGIVLRRVATQAASGIALGLLITLAATRVVSSLLYGVSPLDPPTLLTAAAVLASVTIGGCLIPALSAGRTDPAALMKE